MSAEKKKGEKREENPRLCLSQCCLMDLLLEFSVVGYAGILFGICIKMKEPSHDHVENCMWH